MVSGAQTVESAIEALRAGAFDYVTKPFDLRHVEAAVRRALEHKRLREAKRRYENYLEEWWPSARRNSTARSPRSKNRTA
jgi:DNA-binding NtrC family response regulator